jgi:uncharacterized repeat protein (TIGR01451 family)
MKRENGHFGLGSLLVILVLFSFLIATCITSVSAAEKVLDANLWIKKTADRSNYYNEENITYTIYYGNEPGASKAENVVIVDNVRSDVEILSADPPASAVIGNNLTWDIGTLGPGQSGSITLLVKKPVIELEFKEDSTISGTGFVNVNKKISTLTGNESLKNTATIMSVGVFGQKLSSVTVWLNYKGIIKSMEHGSGYYKEVQRSSLDNKIGNVKLNKELSAQHKTIEVSLPSEKTLKLSSLWSDRTYASTDDNKTSNSVVDEYNYMDSINKETSYNLIANGISYSSKGNFSGGIAHFGYNGKDSNSNKDAARISETYHGSFRTEQSLDSYGTTPAYKKTSSGTGFVSSEKVVSCDLRSFEQGSGSYDSAEAIQAGTIQKNTTLVYMPNDQLAGASKIRYASKWGEAMYSRDAGKGTEILNRISSADLVQMDALMSSTYLSVTGRFNGTNYLKARAFADITNSTDESLRLEQVYVGNYSMYTTIGMGSVEYSYPHINLTKKVLVQNDNIFTYRIWINNDGNKALKPVAVVDLMPEGATFISSTIRPSVQGRIVSWTLQALPPGDTRIIDIKVALASISPSVINRVQAAGRYQNRTIASEASSSPYDIIGQNLTLESIEFDEASSTGDWRPPSCFSLNGTIIGCEYYIEEYYNNLTDECGDLP